MALLLKYELLLHSSTQGVDVQNGFKATLKSQRLELRTRVTRLLIAVLVGTLFVPVGSVGITPLIQQAQASTTISNPTEFLAIQNNLSGDYTLAASFSLSTTSNASYITGNFTGTLDGAGFNISGLSKPLFNKIGDGTSANGVSNLRLITSTVAGGGVLANILDSNSQISRVYVSGTLTGSGNAAGGLIGEAKVNSTVTNSYAAVNVTNSSGAQIGGLIGIGSGAVTSSAASGNVTQTGTGDSKTGGLVGILYGSVTNCFAKGTVTSSAPYSTGGLVGRANGNDVGPVNASVTKSLAIGNVVIVGGGGYSGGLVGSSYRADIKNSYATGNVTAGTANGKLLGELKQYSSVISSYATGTTPSSLIGSNAGPGSVITTSPPTGTGLAVLNEVISGSTAAWGISVDINGSTPYILELETSGFYSGFFAKYFITCSAGGSFSIPNVTITSNSGAACKGNVTVPEGVTTINSFAFNNAAGDANPDITQLLLPSTLTSIGDYSLPKLTGLKSLSIPSSVTYIGVGSLNGSSVLNELTIVGGTAAAPTKTGYTLTHGVNSSIASPYLPQRLVLGSGYTYLRQDALEGAGATELIFGSGTYYVGSGNFTSSQSLQAIDFGSSTSPAVTIAKQNVTSGSSTPPNPYNFLEEKANPFQGAKIRSVRNCDSNTSSALSTRLKEITNDLGQTLFSLRTCNNTPPAITNTDPVSTSGGSAPATVTITGTNFVGLVGVRGVMFGSTPAASYTVNSATSITATPPAAVTSSVYSVTVNTFAGSSTTSRGASDSSLSALTPSAGSLSPSFNSATLNYAASVANPFTTLNITRTVTQVGATTVQYLGETGTTVFTGALNFGTNVIRTVVTSQDGSSTTTYRVNVTRTAAMCSSSGYIRVNSEVSTSNMSCIGAVDLSATRLRELNETFNTASNVTAVKLPDTLQIISNSAFYNTGIAKLVLPPSVTSICAGCIATNSKLTSIEMSGSPSVPVTFAAEAIKNNGNLTRVSFGYSAETSLNLTSYSSPLFLFQGNAKLTTINSCANPNSYLANFLATDNALSSPTRKNIYNGTSNPTVACDSGVAVTGGGTTNSGGGNYPIIASFTATVSGTSVTLTSGSITETSQGLQAKEWLMSTDNYTWTSINYVDTNSQLSASYTKTGLTVGETYYFRFKQRSFRDYNWNYDPDITVTIPTVSSVATLSSLTLSSGTLNTAFDSATETYTASVANAVDSVTVTATKTNSGAQVAQYIGATGTTTFTGSLSIGANVIRTVVTAADETTKKTYTVTVTRAGSSVATLSNLALSTASLSSTFASATETYTASVANSVVSTTVTPTRTQGNATITVNGTSVTSGNASGSIPLNVGSNDISVVVTAQDGTTTKTYTVTVTRAASTVATLSTLTISPGTLSQTFVSATETYTASVGNAVSSITVTPTNTQANATITVNGTSVTSGSASGAISLNVGSNIINVVVTAQDGATTKTYTLTVTRNSNDASLSALALSTGSLNTSFDGSTETYTASVGNSVSSITITPTVTQANATTVQYIGATGTTLFTGPLSVGANVIRTVVTAQDGTTKRTYTVTVTRLSNDATLSNTSVIKGQAPSLGTPNASLGSETAGTLTLTTAQATGSAATTFVPSNSSATISRIVKFAAGSQVSNFESETAFSNGSLAQITTGDFFIVQVTAGDGTVNYTRVNVTVNSNVATLANTSVIKGQTPTFGTPNTTLGSETAGTLTLTSAQASSETATTFVLTNSSATISKIVKFAAGSQVSTFDTATSFTNGSTAQISTGDFFIIKVTAADGTVNYTRVNVTVNSNVASFSAFNFNQLTPSVIGTVDNTANTVQLIVPVGTNVNNLVAAFTFSAGASVAVGGTAQISGTTTNNFTSPVTYVVTSQDSSTTRSYSVSVSFANNPSSPRNLSAVGGQASVSLSWSAPLSDGGRPITGYVIESSLDSTNWTNVGNTNAGTTTLSISSLPNNTTYSFRVRATNVSGSTDYNYSNVASTNTYYYVTCSVSGSFFVSSQTIPSAAGVACKGTATIPQGITGVATNAFAPNTSASGTNRLLTAIVFPATGFTEIGLGGFMNLGLTTVTVPASVTTVGQYAFQNNPLTSATITGGSGGASTTLKDSVFGNATAEYGLSTQIALTFGSGKIDVADNFGSNTKFSTVDFGSALNSIAVNAFKKNSIVAGWIPVFPSTITSISSGAFTENPRMRTIRFGSETSTSITSINEFAFDKNYLKSVQYCGPQGNANPLSRYLRDHQTNATIWCDFVAPNAPTISSTSKTSQQVTLNWTKGAGLNEPPTDTYTVQYKSGGGSWTTLTFETETPLSLAISNLTNGTTYTFRVAANNIAGASPYSSEVQVTPLGLALIAIPDTSTATAGGFTFNITNYSSQSNWSASVTAGSGTVSLGTAVGNVLPVTVTDMNPGATVSVRITTTRTNYETGTADTAGTSLISALTPTFGTASLTTNGYTVPITNYDANYNWSVIPSSGTAQIISGSVRVTGAAFATSVIATVTATRTGYVTGSANFSATTLAALTATYYGNGNTGGSVPSDTSTYQTNATFVVLGNSGTLIRPGYTFAGWKDNLGTDYQPTAQYALASAGVSFYAQWTANPYRVFYNLTEATSGTVPTDANIYAITSTANVRGNPGNLQRTGYVFAGWADNANRNGRIYVSGDTYTVQTSDINFWAAWTPNTYTITYDVNGATGSPSKSSDSYTVGSSVARLALVGTMAKSGYNFGGWATQAVGTPISDSFTVAANTKLFAQWNIASFILTYDLDGGTGTVDSPTAVNYLQQFNLAPATGFTKSSGGISYAFVAWSANSATYNPGQSYIMPAANLIFTATWTRIYNVTYSFSGGSASAIADQQKIALDTITVTSTIPTRTGYTFLSWVDQSGETTTAGATYTVRDGHYLLYAQWQAISYSVTYDVAGGSSAPSESAKTIGQSFLVGAAPTREFYNFNGWFDGTNTYFPGATYVTQSSNITFTAQWQGKEFRVSYDFNGGAGNVGGSYLHTYGSSAYSLPTTGISLTDYNFNGWATSPGGTSVGATFAPSSDISLYAIWNIAIYRLNFNGQSGISESATAKVTIGQSIALPNATRANHTLQGWSTQQSGGSITAAGASFTPNADAILYAQWALQVFTVTFNANGGTSESATAAFTYGSTTPLVLPRATRANYVFDNWYSSAVGGYLIGAGGANFTPTGSVTIYAHWIQASLEGLGDSVKIAEVTVLAGSSSSFSAGSQGSTASVEYTADSLPDGTVITAYVQKTTSRASSIIDSDYNYVLSIVVAWLAPDGTVPDTAVGKPIVVTVTNQNITKGSRIYKLVGTTPRVLGTATENGRFQALLTEDPLVTVAVTEPDSPTAVSAVALDQESALVSWQAPEVNGGSPITGYTATSSGGQSCTTVTTSCTITGLSASTSYTFTVDARNVIGTSLLRAGQSSVTTSAAPVDPNQNTNNNTNSSGGTSDPGAAIAAAQQQAAQAAAAAELIAAQAAAAAEIKAAEEKAAAELKAAEEKAAAELKAAEEKAAAEIKAAEELKAAEIKAIADAELAAQLAAKKITPAVSLYSISPKMTLSAYDLAYMKKYLSKLKKTATVTCIGYTYTQKTTLAKATVLAKKQANAVCTIAKKIRPTLRTSILIRPAKSAPKAAAGAKWVAISYRVDGYQPKK